MQLPPTILSIDKHEKKKKEINQSEGKKLVHSHIEAPRGKQSTMSPKLSSDSELSDSSASDSSKSKVNNSVKPRHANKQKQSIGIRCPRTLETTLFDRLEKMYGHSIKRMLDVQYRRVLYALST